MELNGLDWTEWERMGLDSNAELNGTEWSWWDVDGNRMELDGFCGTLTTLKLSN